MGSPCEVDRDLSEGVGRESGSEKMQLSKVATQKTAPVVVSSGTHGMLGREGGREGGKEGEREGGRERGREGGREGEREGERWSQRNLQLYNERL